MKRLIYQKEQLANAKEKEKEKLEEIQKYKEHFEISKDKPNRK